MFIDGFPNSFFSDERGSVESALVLVPMMVLVLSTLQVAMGSLHRDIGSASTQSSVIQSTLYSPNTGDPLTLMENQGFSQALAIPLSGGGNLYIGKRAEKAPSLTPLLPSGDNFSSIGFALGEHS